MKPKDAWRTIVVGVDGSRESLRAAAVAARIATAARADLVAVHAVPVVPTFSGVVGIEPIPDFSPELQEQVVRASREQIARALAKVAAVQHLEVASGPAPFLIGDVARRRRAGLIVLGGKRHGAFARGLGQSTAHYLVRTLDIPILIVGESAGPIGRVLAAVDLSGASSPTVQAAERFAGLFGARVRLVHVVEPVRFTDLAPDLWDIDAYWQRSEQAFERFAAQVGHGAAEEHVVRDGPAPERIAEAASEWQADVVVVGSHGKGWVDRILLGSTTQRLVTELPASLLVVPAPSRRRARRPATEPRVRRSSRRPRAAAR
jgi:nucleotide-binding universal stress UspA family protein